MTKLWPFPGDAPVVRARKIALAYRAVAEEQYRRAMEMQALLHKVDLGSLGKKNADLVNAVERLLADVQQEDPIGELDRRFRDWGETWHAEVAVHYDGEDIIPAKEGAALIHIAAGTLGKLRMRGRIKGHFMGRERGFYYKVADLYALSSERRGRGWRATDRVPTNGGTAPK